MQLKKQNNFYSKGNDILLLGIGNYLMGDEGVGIHLVRQLEKNENLKHITLIDGGTGGFLLVPCLENHEKVILVDATMDGKIAGTITLLRPKFNTDFPPCLSGHNFGLKDMVEILTLFDRMPDLYLFTVSIEEMKPMCTELSPKVFNAIPKIKEKVLTLIDELQEKENV